MARIDDLLERIDDDALRKALAAEARALKDRARFGLVFERHHPETVLLGSKAGIRAGDYVEHRDRGKPGRWRVEELHGETVMCRGEDGATIALEVGDLLVFKAFGAPNFPALERLGGLPCPDGKDPHLVLKGENFHALELLTFTHAGRVDCIYIDPPYNTGAKDWKYNNRYVDRNDGWRHSKWLSFMEKRLVLARKLLKPDGVLVVTVDEHEVHHLGLLLEQLFRDAHRQMVTIVNNPKGVTQDRFSRVEEHALFCFFGASLVSGFGDDLLTPLADDDGGGEASRPRWKGLLRSGESARREDRKDMFYPVLIDPGRGAVLGAGEPLPLGVEPDFDAEIDGLTPVWPVRRDGSLGRWGVGRITLRALIEQGYVAVGRHDAKRRTWGLSYLSRQHRDQIDAGVLQVAAYDPDRNLVDAVYADPQLRRVKTVWHRSSHDAGAQGSDMVRALLGWRAFPFPKSLYAVRDTLAALVGDKPDALVVDFFAGSGTTLHATALLNARDGGRRRCLLVTNNEVDEESAKRLTREGAAVGDPEWEAHGIFESATRPRCEAALTGRRADGSDVPGSYLDGRPIADGFEEGVEFLELAYLDPDRLELGLDRDLLLPLMWLDAGGRGSPPAGLDATAPFELLGQGLAVLGDPRALPALLAAIEASPDPIGHVYLFTDDQDAFAEMTAALGPGVVTRMLPRDYLRSFRTTTPAPA